jgi:hypothetical protein
MRKSGSMSRRRSEQALLVCRAYVANRYMLTTQQANLEYIRVARLYRCALTYTEGSIWS